MRLIRRICATALVASVALLASCGTDTPAATDSNPISQSTNLDFTMSNGSPYFTAFNANQPSPRTQQVFIGGIIAVASYPALGAPVFVPAQNNNWLTVSTRPQFSRTPLGWNFDVTVDRTGLVDGLYRATIPVMVTGARNNPQTITVTLAVCTSNNCLFMGDSRLTTITNSLPTFTWFNNDYFGGGGYYYFEYRVFLLPGQTAYIQNWGSGIGGGTISDPTVALFNANPPLFTPIGFNDDCNGLNSQFPLMNATATIQEYRLRASTFSPGVTGTETVVISPTPYCGGGESLREFSDSEREAIEAKARAKN